jgi:hypothetical protein
MDAAVERCIYLGQYRTRITEGNTTVKYLQMALAAVLLAACVAPHQHAYDDAMKRCFSQEPGACDQANQLGAIVAQEHIEAEARANAVAAGLLAVSAGLNAAAAARYQQPAVVVVCRPYIYGGC